MQKINGTQLKDFLVDIEENSETILLEEGKEKDDLIQSAKKRGILLIANSMDLGVFKTIYGFTNKANANGAILPEAEFLKVLPQIVGRPVNVGHQRKFIVGFYTDYKYIAKKKQAITYGIFFKSVYPELWKKAVKFQNDGLLSSSFEIWSPQKQRKLMPDGTYELHNMQMAGGAFIFEENGNEPAFKDAKVLSMAKDMTKNIISEECLTYASKYSDDEILTAETEVINREQVICKHCQNEFLPASLDEIKLTCPSCKSIVDRTGVVIHPPQVKDYSLICPDCKGDFTILASTENTQNVQCNGCGKEYKLEFYTAEKPDALKIVSFLYEAESACPQCGNIQCIDTMANAGEQQIHCSKCNIDYPFIIKLNSKRKIKKISIIKKQAVQNPKEKGDNIVESKKFVAGIKKLAEKIMKLKADSKLESANKDAKYLKLESRYTKVLMIARELKGLMKEINSASVLKEQELAHAVKSINDITKESKNKDEIIEKAHAKTKLYKANAQKILERRQNIGEVLAKDMTDEQVLDEKDYEIAMLKKEKDEVTAPKTADDVVGEPKTLHTAKDEHYKKAREEINNIAFPKIK